MFNMPLYVDYTSDKVYSALRTHGFSKLAQANLRNCGVPLENITEKTAGELLQSGMSTHLLTKRYLKQAIENVKNILGE